MDFPEDLETDFITTVKRVAGAVLKGTGAGGFNLVLSNGPASGQEVFHGHFHIIPRFDKDNRVQWDKTEYSEGEMNSYKEKIAKYL